VRTLPADAGPAEAGGEAHATISHSLGHCEGPPELASGSALVCPILSALGLVVWYSGICPASPLPAVPFADLAACIDMALAHCPFADRAAVSNEHSEPCFLCHAMHCMLTCSCIELQGMKLYICIYVSSNHGINDAMQVL